MAKIKIGVSGCGASVWMFGPALISQENAEVVVWMDPNLEAAQSAASQYGGVAYSDYSEMLAHRGLDAVIIASPTWEHLPQAIEASQSDKHILCEKPMARSISECREIIEACENTGVVLMVGFMKRFNPAFIKAKEMIVSGELGEIIEIGCDWCWPQYFLSGWRDGIRGWGGLLQDHGCHTFDLCRWWAGDIETVSAQVRIMLEGREVEDYANVTCRHTGGSVSTHRHTRLTHKPLHECYEITGSKGTLTIECWGQWSPTQSYNFNMKLYRNTEGISSCCTDISLQPQGGLDKQMREAYSYTRELRYFIDCILNAKSPEMCTGTDGLRAIEAVNAAYVSAAEVRTVQLPLQDDCDPESALRVLGNCCRI